MSNVHITKSSPADYADNPVRGGVMDYTVATREYRPAPELLDWRVILARAVVGVIVVSVYGLWKTFYCWSWTRVESCATIAFWEPFIIIMAALIGGALAVWHYAARNAMTQAQATRTNLVLDRFGNQFPADLFQRMDARALLPYLERRYAADIALKMHTAQYEQYLSVNTLSGAGSTSINTAITPQLTEGDQPSGPKLLPASEWLDWFDARPHGLLVAETGGGKSTLFKTIAKSRIERGELLFLLDPHSSDWFGLPAIGGAEDWESIWCGMQVVINEYKARMAERAAYLQLYRKEKPVDDFQRITVLLDESNAGCSKLSHAKRGETSRWDQFAEALGSGARKVGISIILLAQSPNVEDLNLSGSMLNNFTRICLDARTIQMLINQSLGAIEYKRELAAAIEGQEYPAATTIKGKVVLLDRSGFDRIAPPHNPQAALWAEGYDRANALIAAQQPVQHAIAANAQASATVRASVPGAIVYPPRVTSTPGRIAWLLNQGYTYRQIERELSVSHATISKISVALQARRLAP